MPTRKLTDKQLNRKVAELTRLVAEMVMARGGAEHHQHGLSGPDYIAFKLPTALGELRISIHGAGGLTTRGDFTVFCRFDDVDRAVRGLGSDDVNSYSGKWNHHYPDEWSAEQAASDLARQLDSLNAPSGQKENMDPTANLNEQLRIADAINAATDSDVPFDSGDAIEDLQRLAELVVALHEWRLRGGFPPDYDRVEAERIVGALPGEARLVGLSTQDAPHGAAILMARETYACDDVKIDDDATMSECGDDGHCWVSAWVYV